MGAFDNAAWLQHYAEWTPHSIDYGDTTLVDIYINNLAVNAANPATYFFGKTMTYVSDAGFGYRCSGDPVLPGSG